MKIMIFLAAVVNAELLRVGYDENRNANLALNIQSLGKAYDDVGLHVFAKNSIQQMRKAVDETHKQSRTFRTDGLLVNRYLGRVSRIGINTVTLTARLSASIPQHCASSL